MSKKRLHTISSLFGFELKKLISNRLFMMLIFLILCCDMLYMRSYTENRYELYEKIAEQDGYADEYAMYLKRGNFSGGSRYVNIRNSCAVCDTPDRLKAAEKLKGAVVVKSYAEVADALRVH